MHNGGNDMGKYGYSAAFKLRVAKEAVLPENENCERIIADKYEILPSTVEKWRDRYIFYGDKAFSSGYKSKCESNRLRALERENAELKEEVEILKKAAAFLANVKRD